MSGPASERGQLTECQRTVPAEEPLSHTNRKCTSPDEASEPPWARCPWLLPALLAWDSRVPHRVGRRRPRRANFFKAFRRRRRQDWQTSELRPADAAVATSVCELYMDRLTSCFPAHFLTVVSTDDLHAAVVK